MPKIFVGIGEVLWDMLPQGNVLGGAPANFAYYANQLGETGIVASAVGNDVLGSAVLANLKEKQMDVSYIQTNSSPTSTVKVEFDSLSQPQYTITENVAWDFMQMNPALQVLAKQTSVVTFGSLAQRNLNARNAINTFVNGTPSDCLRIFDINLRQHYYTQEIIETSLQQANILKINDDELLVLANMFNITSTVEGQVLQQLLNSYNLKLIVLTKGEYGCRLYSKESPSTSDCGSKITVKDPVGAGDSLSAAVAYCMINKIPLDKTAYLANRVANYVCTQAGATAVLPPELLSEFH